MDININMHPAGLKVLSAPNKPVDFTVRCTSSDESINFAPELATLKENINSLAQQVISLNIDSTVSTSMAKVEENSLKRRLDHVEQLVATWLAEDEDDEDDQDDDDEDEHDKERWDNWNAENTKKIYAVTKQLTYVKEKVVSLEQRVADYGARIVCLEHTTRTYVSSMNQINAAVYHLQHQVHKQEQSEMARVLSDDQKERIIRREILDAKLREADQKAAFQMNRQPWVQQPAFPKANQENI
ncbi:hypothetical protein PENDEC_c001G01892 [Penicillium decumbens]|uniref:Uncharacterized protein n=1 Tax=Penicillium decumbens TaxID=69771 RepID=A0A1V6PMD2_PENDC|nr:hypothetical protein PENDEC_c001G01892 [Penicillium decumbens]